MVVRRVLYVLLVFASVSVCRAQSPATAPAPAAQAAATNAADKPNVIPNTFKNLKVLPTDITKQQLVGVMKQMAITFKVRCSACHAVNDDITEGDFSSDEKPMKLEARKLLRLICATATPLNP